MTKTFELNKNLVKINNNYLCLSEGFKYPPAGSYYWTPTGIYVAGTGNIYPADSRNIIFSTEFLQESIPVLSIESSDDINVLAQKYSEKVSGGKHFRDLEVGFIAGYTKAKETFKYTEEDLKKAFEAGMNYQEGGIILYPDEHGFIQSLQQPKEIKSIEIEYKDWCDYDDDNTWGGLDKPDYRPITLSNGKVKCKINY